MKNLPTITLSKKIHRNEHQILIGLEYNKNLIDKLKSIPQAKWSTTLKSWYILNNAKNLDLVLNNLKRFTIIDKTKLSDNSPKKLTLYNKRERILSDVNRVLLNNFYKYLVGKRYSKSTINTYTFFVADFIEYHNNRQTETLCNRDVELFLENNFVKRGYSISTHRQFVSAMKLFANFYPNCKIDNLQLERPKKSRKLPSVLSQDEVIDLIRYTTNLKHRAIIALLYSCGLRISELINLKLTDIDRKQLFVRDSKGKTDMLVWLKVLFRCYLITILLTNQHTIL